MLCWESKVESDMWTFTYHPDIQLCCVRDRRRDAGERPEHGCEREEGRHAHGHPARNVLQGDEHGEPGQGDEERRGEVGAQHVVRQFASELQAEDHPGENA